MALDLGLTTYQLLSALDDVAPNIRSRRRRLDDAIDRALAVPAGEAAFRTAAVGRRPYIAARTGPEGLLGSRPPPEVPQDWTALSVDGSHIDVDRHLPLRCHLINLGGCAITYGQNHGCQLFNEPTLAVDDADLYLRAPNGASGETLISGPLLGALRTVREVERLADAVENLPDDKTGVGPAGRHPRLLGPAAGSVSPLRRRRAHRRTPAARPGPPWPAAGCFHQPTSGGRGRLHVTTPHHRGRRRPAPHALRAGRRRLQPSLHRPSFRPGVLRRRGRLRRPRVVRAAAGAEPPFAPVPVQPPAARFALGLATGQEWSHFYYLNGGAEIAGVEVPDWLVNDPELLALSHAMLVKQCQLGMGYPVAVSEAHEQAVITGHDRQEFRRLTLMLLEQRGLPTSESAKNVSKRRPWV